MGQRGGSTADFFNFLDRQNNAIAAREAAEAMVAKPVDTGVGVDRIQLKRDAQRREEADGPLRARPRKRSRPVTGRIVRGYMENPGAE